VRSTTLIGPLHLQGDRRPFREGVEESPEHGALVPETQWLLGMGSHVDLRNRDHERAALAHVRVDVEATRASIGRADCGEDDGVIGGVDEVESNDGVLMRRRCGDLSAEDGDTMAHSPVALARGRCAVVRESEGGTGGNRREEENRETDYYEPSLHTTTLPAGNRDDPAGWARVGWVGSVAWSNSIESDTL